MSNEKIRNITNPEVLKYLAESKIYVCLSHER